jgi:hypothetical protein
LQLLFERLSQAEVEHKFFEKIRTHCSKKSCRKKLCRKKLCRKNLVEAGLRLKLFHGGWELFYDDLSVAIEQARRREKPAA